MSTATVDLQQLQNTESSDPVLIPIRDEDEATSSSVPTWALLELNGELITPKEINKENSASPLLPPGQLELGSVRFDDKTPVMILGTHELKGKVEELKQPFCVLRKDGSFFSVSGVITKKILFNQYPKTIMR